MSEHNSSSESNWKPVLLLKLPDTREFSTLTLVNTWKRNSRGLRSRVNYAFKLAKKINATVYIHDTDTPLLNTLNAYPGEPKDIPETFWDQF